MMKVRIYDGSYHQVDSDSMSFELCAKQGFREAARKAKPVLLEPIMKFDPKARKHVEYKETKIK
jgi:elongation factor G